MLGGAKVVVLRVLAPPPGETPAGCLHRRSPPRRRLRLTSNSLPPWKPPALPWRPPVAVASADLSREAPAPPGKGRRRFREGLSGFALSCDCADALGLAATSGVNQ